MSILTKSLLPIIFIGSLAVMVTTQAAPYVGTLYYSGSRNVFGISHNYHTLVNSNNAAKADCINRSHAGDCRFVFNFYNPNFCAVGAVGNGQGVHGAGKAGNIQQASYSAMQVCQRGGFQCHVAVQACNRVSAHASNH